MTAIEHLKWWLPLCHHDSFIFLISGNPGYRIYFSTGMLILHMQVLI